MDFEKIYCDCEGKTIRTPDGEVKKKVYLGTIGPAALVEFPPCKECKAVTRVIRRSFDACELFHEFPKTEKTVKTIRL